jgi:hypothetical protein
VRELGLVYTPIRDTIARTVAWYEAQGLLERDERHAAPSG